MKVLDLLLEPLLGLGDDDDLRAALAVGVVGVVAERGLLALEFGGHGSEALRQELVAVQRPLEIDAVTFRDRVDCREH